MQMQFMLLTQTRIAQHCSNFAVIFLWESLFDSRS